MPARTDTRIHRHMEKDRDYKRARACARRHARKRTQTHARARVRSTHTHTQSPLCPSSLSLSLSLSFSFSAPLSVRLCPSLPFSLCLPLPLSPSLSSLSFSPSLAFCWPESAARSTSAGRMARRPDRTMHNRTNRFWQASKHIARNNNQRSCAAESAAPRASAARRWAISGCPAGQAAVRVSPRCAADDTAGGPWRGPQPAPAAAG